MVIIDISNRGIYTFVAVIVVALLAVGVHAYNLNSASPSTFGHTSNELTFIADSVPLTAVDATLCESDGTGCPTVVALEEPASSSVICDSTNEGKIMYFPEGLYVGGVGIGQGVFICMNIAGYDWYQIDVTN
jgi:hypothetical protein